LESLEEKAMALRVSGKNMDIGEALRGQVEARVAQALGKYVEGGTYSGHVTVARDGSGFRTDCVLHLSSGVTLEAHGRAHDAYAAFNESAERIEKRLRRHKRRLRDRSSAYSEVRNASALEMPSYVLESPGEEVEETQEFHPVVVAESTASLHELSVSDAVLELDMTGVPVLVFRHAGHGRINVVYRRRDGTIGWIDPPAERRPAA
jgi:ribosomal subunit interface protein